MSAEVVINGYASLLNMGSSDGAVTNVINGQGGFLFSKSNLMIVNLIVVDPLNDKVKLDKTRKEIHDAFDKGVLPVIIYSEDEYERRPIFLWTYKVAPDYCVSPAFGDFYNLTTLSEDGYPAN